MDSRRRAARRSDYLARTNFKSLIEWMTAECILNRPEDPVQYCRNLLDIKISDRAGQEFAPTQPTEYVRGCYAEASAMADEHGRIHGKVVAPVTSSLNTQANAARDDAGRGERGEGRPPSPRVARRSPRRASPSRAPQMGDLQDRLALLEKIVVASRNVSTHLDPVEACNTIVSESCSILNADRASIFTLTPDRKMLKLHVAEGATSITVPIGVGIAGTVAQSGAVCNISDAYNDARFDPSSDRKSGYKTNSILCGPIRDADAQVVGVVQMINKANGPFGPADEEVLDMLSGQAGIALRNADLWNTALANQAKVNSMMDLIKALYGNLGINSLIFTLTNRVPDIVDADRCTIYIHDAAENELWAMQGEANFKVKMDKTSIVGASAVDNEIINIPDAYADERFNTDVDKQTGYTTKTILCMPITHKDEVVGALQLMNKSTGVFTSEDETLLQVFLQIVGGILSHSKLTQRKKEEAGAESFHDEVVKTTTKDVDHMEGFAEGDEEEEDD